MVMHSPHALYALGQERSTGVSDPEEHRRCLAATRAVARYEKNARLAWEEWIQVTGPALAICRQAARLRARDFGGRYEAHMRDLLAFYQLDTLDKSNRSALLWIMDRLDKVEAWRELQPDKTDLNNPQVVYSAFRQKSSTGNDAKKKDKLGDIALLHKELKEKDDRIRDLEWELAGCKYPMENSEILRRARVIYLERNKARRAEHNKRIRTQAFPDGSRLYSVVLADPAWTFTINRSPSCRIDNHYPTMSLEEICALPVKDLLTTSAVLFLWCPAALMLHEGKTVIEAWGFDYKTCVAWDKGRGGMGDYFRMRHEILLFATKGKPLVPEPGNRPESVIMSPRRGHSEKPYLYPMIEKMYPDFNYLELFARNPRRGWDSWGNENLERPRLKFKHQV
jgi:N6-adenosine-specific RNA methylase IME4